MSLKHLKPIKFYSMATPNGVKVSTFLEDLKNEYELPYEYVTIFTAVGSLIEYTSLSAEEINISTNKQKEPWFLKIVRRALFPGFYVGTDVLVEPERSDVRFSIPQAQSHCD
jgi:hypothetical protein